MLKKLFSRKRKGPYPAMPEITVMSENERERLSRKSVLSEMLDECKFQQVHWDLLNEVAKTARKALWKLDIEFNKAGKGKVAYLEGWCEANQLRYAIEDLDKYEARKIGDA